MIINIKKFQNLNDLKININKNLTLKKHKQKFQVLNSKKGQKGSQIWH